MSNINQSKTMGEELVSVEQINYKSITMYVQYT